MSIVGVKNMSMRRSHIIAMALAGTLLSGGHASAMPITFSNVNDTGTVNFGGNIDGTDVPGLSATLELTLSGISGNEFQFAVSLENTTDGLLWEESRISRIGFNSDSNVNDVEASLPWFATLNGSLPNQFGAVDICVQAQTQGDCSGGPGGPGIGQTAAFDLTLIFASAPSEVTLDNFGIRWQALNSDALGFDDESGTGTPTTQVPEPGSLALFGLGLLALGLLRRRFAA